MRQLALFACAVLLCAGCSVQRPLLPSADFQVQDSNKFFATPSSDSVDKTVLSAKR
jgi:hypothetical protein